MKYDMTVEKKESKKIFIAPMRHEYNASIHEKNINMEMLQIFLFFYDPEAATDKKFLESEA